MASAPKIAVIGSGIAGMMSALRLSRMGCDVTIFEAQSSLGGKIATEKFTVGNSQINVDCGPTVFSMKPLFEEMFEEMGLSFDSSVTTKPHHLLARHYWPGKARGPAKLDLYSDIEQSSDMIGDFAGADDAAAFRKIIAHAQDLFSGLDHTFMRATSPNMLKLIMALPLFGLPMLVKARPWQSLWSLLKGRFQDPRLVQLFARYSTYCGGNPMQTSALFLLVLQAEFAGLWSLDGGMAALATAMEKNLSDAGATIYTNAHVDKILTTDSAVKAIQLADERMFDCDAVIMAGDISYLASIVPDHFVSKAPKPVAGPNRSLSATTLTTVGEITGLETAAHTVFFSADYEREFGSIKSGLIPDDPTLYLNKSRCSEQDDHNALSRMFFIANARALQSDETKISPADSKERFLWQKQIETKLQALGVHLSHQVAPKVTMPQDFAQRFPGSGGALYGRAPHGMLASFRRPGLRTKIPGLYLASGSAHPSAGVPMSALSGFTAAGAVITDLVSTRRLHRGDISGGTSML